MRPASRIQGIFILVFIAFSSVFSVSARELTIPDILEWKTIRSAALSRDGSWFACRLVPQEGDSKVLIRETEGDKCYRFPAGESSRGDLTFTDNGRWLAFTVYPSMESKKNRKGTAQPENSVALVRLENGGMTEYKGIQNFALCHGSRWLALHGYAPASRKKDDSGYQGTDLLLVDLNTMQQINIGNVSEFAFDKHGRFLVWLVDAHEQRGNGIQLRRLSSGEVTVLEQDSARYSNLNWTEEGEGFTVLKEHVKPAKKKGGPSHHSILGFKDLDRPEVTRALYDPALDDAFPSHMSISPHQRPRWSDNLDALIFGIHEMADTEKDENKSSGSNDEEIPALVIWHHGDDRLQSMQQVQAGRDKTFSYTALYRIRENTFYRLADDSLRLVYPAPKDLWALGYDESPYLWMANLDGRRYRDIYAVNMKNGQRHLLISKCRWPFTVSPTGTHFLYYENGHYYTVELAGGKPVNITRDMPVSFIDTEDDHNVIDPPIRPVGWDKTGRHVLLYDNWDVWQVDIQGRKWKNLTKDGRTQGKRYARRVQLDPDEKGIDLSLPLYFFAYGEWNKKSGITQIHGKDSRMIFWDDARYGSLMKAEEAERYLYTRETFSEFPDYYTADGEWSGFRRLTEANPRQDEYAWTAEARLIEYRGTGNQRMQGALFLPAEYEEGKTYPAIVYIYETLSQTLNTYNPPRTGGFSRSLFNHWGYAVLMPDIKYKVNDPGMSAVWCVLPALDAAIETGVIDPERIGLHGHSWGGYQTAFLITQTGRFKAAAAGAPLTNLISMYSSIYWNTGSANQPIFESQQGRFTGGYWELNDAYRRNSPVYFARDVETPLLLLHNDKDGAVDWNQGIEYYNALRRLGKSVIMLQYKGENHGVRKPANRKDYTLRMKEFFDHHLRGGEAPVWMTEGIPHLKMEEHLKERIKLWTQEAPKDSSHKAEQTETKEDAVPETKNRTHSE
ncbi:MAG TPA: S9 family peptidase [bacterium]|nr:S9 family peptidase [bacterium]